ncbi:exocyst complex component Sec6-domain-containing protein [Lasiosphaeria miniovina]|uniref:Exocyst complex component Sec6-domain-containing protein n=1 Tax=Lasiosphaeria miniovina TaxID=1954250 RepID=A0AA40A0F3_9PEZI|nr:exocyst complex component Sec6-domain-containing protein [Lasiosphaeria miniovina]KAK0706949.1 exocyst complex component Sec6-domain-containing protein [Lasiosphaeria miniovina]
MDVPPVKLAELLRHPDDLDKIAALKAEFTRKKAAVDSQLRSGLRDQLETTQSGMNGLADGQKTVQQIKEEMMKIDKICSGSQNMITDFATINLVSQAHRNFGAVEAMRRNLEIFSDRLNGVLEMLRQDDADAENMPNLLAIHYELTQLRNIRDDAIEQIQRGDDPSLQSTLEDYFERLDSAVKWFDEHITLIAQSLINLVVDDNNSLVVRFALVIEAEEKSDQRVLALQEALKDHKEIATRFQSITDGAKTVRGYKDKFLNAIKQVGESQFAESREQFLGDPKELEKSLKWYFNDLNTVRLGMVQLMPKKWKIFKTWATMYHDLMHAFLVRLIDDPQTSSSHTLEIVSWPEKYYRKMNKLGFKQDELTPHVIDNRETELVRDFRSLIIRFLDEWIDRIFVQERKDFAARNAEGGNLEVDEYGYFRTKNLVDLWRMLREQLDVAANSKRADVVEGVVDAMFQRLRTRQQGWQKMLEDEAARYETGKVVELDGFQPLQDWLVATANDQIACIDDSEDGSRLGYLSDFQKKFTDMVTPQYMERAESEVMAIRDGYVDLSTWCITKFAQLVFTIDFKTVMPDFFTAKWYTSTAMARMVATFEEYVSDYKQVLHHSLLDIFIEIFAEELLIRYLSSVRNKGAKFRRSDKFQDKIFDDLSTAFGYFSNLPNPGVGISIKETWRVTEPFLQLLTVEKEQVPAVFEAFKRGYWDLQISWVEAVLRSRDDFDRSMLNAVKARAAQMDVVRGPETVMSKVK